MTSSNTTRAFVALLALLVGASPSVAQDSVTEPEQGPGEEAKVGAPGGMSAEETAKQLANPNTAVASLTLKSQWMSWAGKLPGADGHASQTFLFQPSFPFPINDSDRIFLRPAFPFVVDQPVVDGTGKVRGESGFADMGMDLAFGRTMKSGIIVIGGIVAGLPTGKAGLSSDTWTLGPEFFIGKMSRNSFIGIFPNHQWDLSGHRKISLTSIQPLLSFLLGGGWAVASSGQISYSWVAEQWTIPLNLGVSRAVKVGALPLKVMLEASYYVERPDALGQKWLVGFNVTPVVPNVVANWLSGN